MECQPSLQAFQARSKPTVSGDVTERDLLRTSSKYYQIQYKQHHKQNWNMYNLVHYNNAIIYIPFRLLQKGWVASSTSKYMYIFNITDLNGHSAKLELAVICEHFH